MPPTRSKTRLSTATAARKKPSGGPPPLYGVTVGPRMFFVEGPFAEVVRSSLSDPKITMIVGPMRATPDGPPKSTMIVKAHISAWEEWKRP